MQNDPTIQLVAADDEAGLMLVAHAARVINKETGHGFYLTCNPDSITMFLYTQEAMKKSIAGGDAVRLETFYLGNAAPDNLDQCGKVAEDACKAAGIPYDFQIQHGEEPGKGELMLACGNGNHGAVYVPVTFNEDEFQAIAHEQREEEVEGGAA